MTSMKKSSVFLVVIMQLSVSSAYALCSGYACDGKDPKATGCENDARTVASKKIYGLFNGTDTQVGYVELRWSNACKSNWARVTSTNNAYVGYGAPKIATVTRSFPYERYYAYHTGYWRIWSPMVYGDNLCTNANGDIDWSSNGGYATTKWVCK